ncbi:MAG: DUF1634 domain-containing protein [Chloroflexota bacterium]
MLVRAWTDDQAEQFLGTLLRSGVIIASAVVLFGGIFYLLHYGSGVPDYRVFRGEPADLRDVAGIVSDSLSLRSRGVIQLGLLLLIATPVLRVVFSVLAFALQRDWTYVATTLIVLSVLIYAVGWVFKVLNMTEIFRACALRLLPISSPKVFSGAG